MNALECIACGHRLGDSCPGFVGNQPLGGTAFFSYGHYGSTAFDPMDGQFLELNVCDPCLRDSATKGRVLIHPPRSPGTDTIGAGEVWDGAAQGIEARQGGDGEAGSIEDESPAGEAGVP